LGLFMVSCYGAAAAAGCRTSPLQNSRYFETSSCNSMGITTITMLSVT
jgi:hypothetical protein